MTRDAAPGFACGAIVQSGSRNDVNQTQNSPAERDEYRVPPAGTLSRGFLGGVLMGLANLVPMQAGGPGALTEGEPAAALDSRRRCHSQWQAAKAIYSVAFR